MNNVVSTMNVLGGSSSFLATSNGVGEYPL